MNDQIILEYLTPVLLKSDEPIWVNPIGGLGDIIMLSSAMKKSFDIYGKKFNVVRRAIYSPFFVEHPAVDIYGNPPVGSMIICNNYWNRIEFQNPNMKAYRIVQKIFGVVKQADDTLFVKIPKSKNTDNLLANIPWGKKNVAISVTSESPRKEMHPFKWNTIVDKLVSQNCFVVQIGRINDYYIKGAYSLLGATNIGQVFNVLNKIDILITIDNFVMHAAKVVNVPTVSLFGPTEASRYAYDSHYSFQGNVEFCPDKDKCLGPHCSDNYTRFCPYYEQHCMNQFDENRIVDVVMSIINKK